MTSQHDEPSARERQLHAYHDGELSGLSRWRFERALRRSPALRRELEELSRLSGMLQAHEGSLPAPDLWDAIALRLPAEDARRAEATAGRAASGRAGPWWLKPVGALVAAAAVVAAVWIGMPGPEVPAPGGVVRWIDTGARSVVVLDDQPDATIIWVLDAAGEGVPERSGRESV